MLRTSDPAIYAIGEVAEVHTTVYGTTSAAQEQARTAAACISGDYAESYGGTTPMSILKIRDFSLSSVGNSTTQDDDTEEVVVLDEAARYYKKCYVRGGKLIGALLVGDQSELGEFLDLIAKETELDEIRWTLLRGPGKKSIPPKGRIVCSCHNVGHGNIEDALNAGCDDLESIGKRTCAGTACGSCRSELNMILLEAKTGAMETAIS
jgi:ferredoxin-nitrate reductase